MAKKIIFWISFSLIILLTAGFITLAFVNVDNIPRYSDPNTIVVFENGQQNSLQQVLRTDQSEKNVNYNVVYDDVKGAFKQNSLKALFNGTLFKNYQVNTFENQKIDFSSGTWILFHYSTFTKDVQYVQNAKGKIVDNASYSDILFKVSASENDVELITFYLGSYINGEFTCSYSYSSYGNFNKLLYDLNI